MIVSRAPDARDDKWFSGLYRNHSKPTRPTLLSPFPRASPNLIDGEARSRVENSHRAIRASHLSRAFVVRITELAEIHDCDERSTGRENCESCYLFFSPCLSCSARRIGWTIYFRCVKTSDWWLHDANSTMWELIVTRSHRRGIIKTAYE